MEGGLRASVARRGVVGVMGSGVEPHEELALPLGRWIAERGFHLLTGGGGGVMAAVSRGFASVPHRRGLAIGVLPAGPPPGYPNPWVDVAIRTHLEALGERGQAPESRNHINVLSSDVVVALPGGAGTRSEIALAARYGRPVVRIDPRGDAAAPDAPLATVPAVRTLDALFEAVLRILGA